MEPSPPCRRKKRIRPAKWMETSIRRRLCRNKRSQRRPVLSGIYSTHRSSNARWKEAVEIPDIRIDERGVDIQRKGGAASGMRIRFDAWLTQMQLAEILGKPESYVSKAEVGERRLDFPRPWISAHSVGALTKKFCRCPSGALENLQSALDPPKKHPFRRLQPL